MYGNGSAGDPSDNTGSLVGAASGFISFLKADGKPIGWMSAIVSLINLTTSGFTLGQEPANDGESLGGICISFDDGRYRIHNDYNDNQEHIGVSFAAEKSGNATGARTCGTFVQFGAKFGATKFQSGEIYSS